ncbi:dienelactone hydrolase family protein [Pedobacter sp. SYP-B3415]|uniref:dienelactone hydrolase family protein n=1 Tax=Pedobacter sp. SYP-B3415 TaxID=2496641 RepID=UPI00101D6232|nr:dienelactone hydrolase family protein [Pedobacter sp. SYP-B3415]
MNKILLICTFLALYATANAQKLDKATAAKLSVSAVDAAKTDHRRQAAAAWQKKSISYGDKVMKFETRVFGQADAGKRSLYISLHGGGNTQPKVNDGQWENQKKLYSPAEGLYFVPRAPTNTWNLWHEEHIDAMLDEVIKSAVVFEGVDPNRVYLLGYSAGGDGLYQLAPRMADRLAAASMMAGHPGDASALPLRNLPFAIFMGGNDAAYDRNKLAAVWGKKLDSLEAADPGAYKHDVHIYEGLGHWMNRKDTVAISWMAGFKRNALPEKVIWVQDDRRHFDFYWLGTDTASKAGDAARVLIRKDRNEIVLEANTFQSLAIYLNDDMLDLDRPVWLTSNGKTLFKGKLKRSAALIRASAAKRLDTAQVFSAGLRITHGRATAL